MSQPADTFTATEIALLEALAGRAWNDATNSHGASQELTDLARKLAHLTGKEF